MFGFIGKFKSEVVEGFTSVHQRLVTLEAKVDALFHHNNVVANQDKPAEDSAKAENDTLGSN